MKKPIVSILFIGVYLYSTIGVCMASDHFKPEQIAEKIQWFGNAAIKIKSDGKIIYIDPVGYWKEPERADVILITHPHEDHFSISTISAIVKTNTIFFAPKECATKIQSSELIEKKFKTNINVLEPGQSKHIGDLRVEAVPAYTIVKVYHPRDKNWVGYILSLNNVRIYHAGDTERIPEMKRFKCAIALLPLGQTYTMENVENAAKAALDVKAKIAIPIHYGTYEGSLADAKTFKKLLKGKVNVMIKPKE